MTTAVIAKKRFSAFAHKADITKILLAAMLIILIFVPLLRMFLNMDAQSVGKVVSSETFPQILLNSVLVSVISTVFTLILAYITAFCVERTSMKLKGLFAVLFVLPMLIPSISNGMGLVILFGNNGMLTNLLHLNEGIYGLWGIVFGSMLYAFPVAFLMLRDVMKYQDCSSYEAADVLGISKWRQFVSITLPYLKRPLISAGFATFALVITDYGVPLMIGGKFKTLPVVMYEEVIGQLNFGKGAVYGAVLLIPAVIAFLLDILGKDRANAAFVIRPYTKHKNKLLNLAAYLICSVAAIFAALPLVSFGVIAFAKQYPDDNNFSLVHVFNVIKLHAGQYLLNSILIALAVALVGIAISFITAYLSARMKSPASKFLHLACITSAAIPGIVLGLSYVITFKQTFFYGTLIILIMVNLIHFIASPYLMMYNSMSKINENMEAVGQTLGVSRIRMLKDVFLPQSRKTLLEMFVYFFVNCMMTISAVSFLATTVNKPVALMINQFEAQMQLESAAVISLLILVVNLFVKWIVHLIKNKDSNRLFLWVRRKHGTDKKAI